MTAVSDENGYFEFNNIPYGEYAVKEIAAPAGYIFSDEKYHVVINEDGDVIEITAENKPITVEISKRDIYGNELVGAPRPPAGCCAAPGRAGSGPPAPLHPP